MPKTVPGRRVLVAADDHITIPVTPEDMVKPETRPAILDLTYEQRLERQIIMLNNGMTKYEKVLEAKGELPYEDEKRLIVLIDSARKLELALVQIRFKTDDESGKSDLDLALIMIDKGLDYDLVCANFAHHSGLATKLKEALDARQE